MKNMSRFGVHSTRKLLSSLGSCFAALAWVAAVSNSPAALSETHAPDTAVVGGKLTFTYTLSDLGTTPGVFTNQLAPNTVFVSANVTNGSYTVSNNVFRYVPDTSVAVPAIVFDVVVTPVTAQNVTNIAFWVPEPGDILSYGEVVPVTPTQTGPEMVIGRLGHQSILLAGGAVLVSGGAAITGGYILPTATAEIFDPSSNTFSLVGNMTIARQFHTATLLTNGMVLVAGGKTSSAARSTSLDLFDPTNKVFIPAGNMTVARASHTATLLPNGEVILAGGAGTDARIEKFSLATGQPAVSLAGNLAVPRSGHLATVLGSGQILFAGGADASSAFAEKYNPSNGVSVAASASGHGLPAVAIAQGKVLLYGWTVQPNYAAELYDIGSNTFQTLAAPQPTYGENFLTLANGEVLITAGLYSFAVNIFKPLAGTFGASYPVNISRDSHSAVELPDGRVLLTGGNDLIGTLSGDMRSTELYAIRLDMDQDGMDDAWELANGFDPANRADAIQDADSDGFTNLQEYLAGTDPHDPTSNLRIQNFGRETSMFRLTFTSVTGKFYRVQRSTYRAGATWTDITGTLPGTGAPIEVTDVLPPGATNQIYRVQLVQ